MECPRCGSTNAAKIGRKRKGGAVRYQCNDCGAVFVPGQQLLTKFFKEEKG